MRVDLETITRFLEVPGPTGMEAKIQETFLEVMGPHVNKRYTDGIGNCYCEITGDENKPRIVLNAHCDTVGFMVKYIDDRGFIFTEDIGGNETNIVDPRSLPGTDVQVLCRKDDDVIPGHFNPVVPIHLVSSDDLEDAVERSEIPIDIGAYDQEARRHVSVGDYVVFKSEPRLTKNKKRLISTNLDDRVGLYCLYAIAKRLARTNRTKKCSVILVSTVSEEAAMGAASPVVHTAEPDIAITVDVTIATDAIVNNADFAIAKEYGDIRLDRGPVLARGVGVSDDVFLALEQIAQKAPLPYQIELSGGDTDSIHIQSASGGTKTGVIMVPVRNPHTRIETVSLKDIDTVADLCVRYIRYVDTGK